MNNSTAVFLINDKVRAILATYDPDRKDLDKTLFKTFDQTIKVGDLVVVPTGTRHGFTGVKVTDVDVDFDIDTHQKIEWVVSKIDIPGYETILAKEAEAITMIQSAEKTKRRNALREALFADQAEKINALPIAHVAHDNALPKA